jgi:hypothetical protein
VARVNSTSSHVPCPSFPPARIAWERIAGKLALVLAHPPAHAGETPVLRPLHQAALDGVLVDVSHVPLELGEITHVTVEAPALLPEAGASIIARDAGEDRGVKFPPARDDTLRSAELDPEEHPVEWHVIRRTHEQMDVLWASMTHA